MAVRPHPPFYQSRGSCRTFLGGVKVRQRGHDIERMFGEKGGCTVRVKELRRQRPPLRRCLRPGGTSVNFSFALSAVCKMIADAPREAPTRIVEYLHDAFPHYDWVGIYWVEGQDLVLGPWKGPAATEHTRIPIGKGVCGAAAASGRTEVVADVSKDPRYLACFASTKSEIVVPIRAGTSSGRRIRRSTRFRTGWRRSSARRRRSTSLPRRWPTRSR